jgi:hypothetical protein
MDGTTAAFLIGLAVGGPLGWHFGNHNKYLDELLAEAERDEDQDP